MPVSSHCGVHRLDMEVCAGGINITHEHTHTHTQTSTTQAPDQTRGYSSMRTAAYSYI